MKNIFIKFSALLIFCFLATASRCQTYTEQAQHYVQVQNLSKDTMSILKISAALDLYSYNKNINLTSQQFATSGENQKISPDIVYSKLALQLIDNRGVKVLDTNINFIGTVDERVTYSIKILADTTFKLETIVTDL